MDVDFRSKLACVFILKLYDAQWTQLLHLKTVQIHHEKCEQRLDLMGFYCLSNEKPFRFYPMSLAVFAPMLCSNSNVLAVITCGIKD